MNEAVPPWNCPAAVRVGGGGSITVNSVNCVTLWQTRRNPAAQSYGTVAHPKGALCSPDCNWQNRGNPATQRLDLPRQKRDGSPPAGYFASENHSKERYFL